MKFRQLLSKLITSIMKDNKTTSTFFDEMVGDHSSNDTNYTFDQTEEANDSLYVPPIPIETTSSIHQESLSTSESNDVAFVSHDINDVICIQDGYSSLDDNLVQTNGTHQQEFNKSQQGGNNPKTIPLTKGTKGSDISNDTSSLEPVPTKEVNSIVANIVDLFNELDALSQRTSDSNVLSMLSFVQERIIEIICVNGGSIISDLTGFQSEKHRTEQFAIIPENTQIKNILRHGLSFNGKTIIKAVVEV